MSEEQFAKNDRHADFATPINENHDPGEDRKALRFQFLRRLILLLIAFFLALIVITLLGSALVNKIALTDNPGIPAIIERAALPELISQFLPKSLPLLAASLITAFILSVIAVAVAVGIHQLEQTAGWPGSVLKGIGRIVIFGSAALPVFIHGMLLIGIFAFQLNWLPAAGLFSPGQGPTLGSRLKHLILPTLALSLLPALLTSQSTARWLTLPRGAGLPHGAFWPDWAG